MTRPEKLLSDLHSSNEATVLSAIARIAEHGTPDVIEPLVHLLVHGPTVAVEKQVHHTLSNLKDPNCLAPLMDCAKNEHFRTIRPRILSFIWQSGLNGASVLDELIQIALHSEFETFFEALTIIDNSEFEHDDAINGAIARVETALEYAQENAPLLGNLRQVLVEKLVDKA